MSQRPSSPATSSFKGIFTKVDKKKVADAGTAALVAGLKGVKAVLDTSSIPGASAVFSVILSCIDEAQKASRNADILKGVKAQVEAILALLEPLNTAPGSTEAQTISQDLRIAALDLATDLSKRARVVDEKTRHAIRPAWMTRGSDEEALQDFARTVEDDLKRFQLSQGNRIERHLEAIRADVQVIKENTREIRRRGTATEKETAAILNSAQAIQTHTEAIGATTSATKALALEEAAEAREREWDRLLDNVRRAPLAAYNSERPGTIDSCADQTRVELLEEVDKWIAGPASDHIYWLKERAGFGKTAVALSVAERAAARGELAASFFFSHQLSDLNNASLVFPTLAFQLALFDNGRYRQVFAEAVRKFPDAGAAKLKHQVEALFTKPLRQVEPTSQPIVIVIDALDECNREHAQELVDVLTNALKTIPLPLRVFITSRPEHHLITTFESAGISSRTVTDTSFSDVETYLRQELPDIPRRLGLAGMSSDWITEVEMLTLVRQAAGLFVYASTVVRFVRYPTARKRLEILLREDEAPPATYQPYQPLDRLYTRVLDVATEGQPDLVEEVVVVLGARIVAEEDLPLSSLASLLSLDVSALRRTLVRLQSVIVCPESDTELVTFHHASFKDFLLDQSRSGPVYFIDTPIHHHRIALGCMRISTQSPLRERVEVLVTREDSVVYEASAEWDVPKDLTYATEWVFSHTVKARYDIALRNSFDACCGYPWWFDIFQIDGTQVRDACSWRREKGDLPTILVVLERFASLQPFNGRWVGPYFKCYAFARKELRRYCRLATEYPEDRGGDADSNVALLHERVWGCVPKTVDSAGWPGTEAEKRCCQMGVIFAQELEGILDDFMLSTGKDEEVSASRRHTQYIRSQLRDTLITMGCEAPPPGEGDTAATGEGNTAVTGEPEEIQGPSETKDAGGNDPIEPDATAQEHT